MRREAGSEPADPVQPADDERDAEWFERFRQMTAEVLEVTEQRDVYRSRCQQLAGRVAELEDQLRGTSDAWIRDADRINAGTDRVAALAASLRSLIARIRRTGGYATPEEQDMLREAEELLGG